MQINLVILSEDAVSLAGLEAIVNQDRAVRLVGRGMSWIEGSVQPQDPDSRPDVIILGEPQEDTSLTDSIANITTQIGVTDAPPKIIVIASTEDDEVILTALRAGVTGYFTRITAPEDLLRAIQIVASGGAVFSSAVADRFSRYFAGVAQPIGVRGLADLTSRELEILPLLADGLGNHQIARRLFLAEKTVRNYVSRIFAKLDVHDRAAAAVCARAAGLHVAPTIPSRTGDE